VDAIRARDDVPPVPPREFIFERLKFRAEGELVLERRHIAASVANRASSAARTYRPSPPEPHPSELYAKLIRPCTTRTNLNTPRSRYLSCSVKVRLSGNARGGAFTH